MFISPSGHKEASIIFARESNTAIPHSALPNINSLDLRTDLRLCIENGQIDVAIEKLNDFNPQIIDGNPKIFFMLLLCKFVEMVRTGDLERAVEFAAEELAPRAEENVIHTISL